MPRQRQRRKESESDRLMVSFRPGQRDSLRELARKSGLSESQVVRLIVEEFLERNDGKEVRFKLAVKD
jgi:hypothetical protein